MIRVVGDGVTTTTLEYYAEAEPRLIKLQELYRTGKVTKDQVIDSCKKISGMRAIENDMAKLNSKDPGSVSQITEFIEWQAKNPLRTRLYGKPGVIAALILAAPDAKEVRYEYSAGV